MELVRLIEQKQRIINVDETWLNESGFIRKAWALKDGQGNIQLNAVTPRLSMIAAMDTEGEVWFSLAHAATDSDVICLFWWQLTRRLDAERPGWREDTVFLWDNATYHTSAETHSVLRRLGLQVIFTGPYSYDAAPIETLFSQLKRGDLNPERLPTGKR